MKVTKRSIEVFRNKFQHEVILLPQSFLKATPLADTYKQWHTVKSKWHIVNTEDQGSRWHEPVNSGQYMQGICKDLQIFFH